MCLEEFTRFILQDETKSRFHYTVPIGDGYSIRFSSKGDPGNPRGHMIWLKAMQGSGEKPGTTEAKLEKVMLKDGKFCNNKFNNLINIYEAPSIYQHWNRY